MGWSKKMDHIGWKKIDKFGELDKKDKKDKLELELEGCKLPRREQPGQTCAWVCRKFGRMRFGQGQIGTVEWGQNIDGIVGTLGWVWLFGTGWGLVAGIEQGCWIDIVGQGQIVGNIGWECIGDIGLDIGFEWGQIDTSFESRSIPCPLLSFYPQTPRGCMTAEPPRTANFSLIKKYKFI
jgi:hypothetical protein